MSTKRARRPLRIALFALGVVTLMVVVGFARRMREDMPVEVLRARWGTGASRFVDVDGMQVHYRDEGSGPTVVLLHGTSSSLHTWDGWVSELSRRYRVVRFDLPAFGLTGPSPARDYGMDAYAGFVDHVTTRLGLGTFVLGGNSLGGRIAWHFAIVHPERIRGLVLVDAGGYRSTASGRPWAFRLAEHHMLPRILTRLDPRPLVVDGLRKSYGDPTRIRPGVVDRYVELSLRPGNREAFIDRMQTDSPDDSARIASLRTPTLVLWGAKDRLIDPKSAERFQHDIPGAKLVVYDDLGHIPMEEDPQRTVRDVEAFLDALR
jgi:pimeloyl-ACP methyl ester carboxylesterase